MNETPEGDCNCPERFIERNGVRERLPIPFYDFHSCKYVQERSELVTRAMRNAIASTDGKADSNEWMRHFASEMDRLWQEHEARQ